MIKSYRVFEDFCMIIKHLEVLEMIIVYQKIHFDLKIAHFIVSHIFFYLNLNIILKPDLILAFIENKS